MNQAKGFYLVLGTAFISGFSVFVNKFAIKGIDPYFFTFLKNVAAGLLLLAVIALFKNWRSIAELSDSNKLKLVLIGFVGGSIPFLLFFKGLSMTSAVKAGFIHKTMFIYIGILAVVFLKEKISKSMFFGFLSLLAGSILFLKIRPEVLGIGDLYILAATLLWAVEITISKKVLENIPGTVVGTARLLVGSLFILAFLLFTGRSILFSEFSLAGFGWALACGALLAGYNFTFYNGLKYIKASEAAAILTLGAPITAVLTIIYSGGAMQVREAAGIGFLVLGVILMSGVFKRCLSYFMGFMRSEQLDERA